MKNGDFILSIKNKNLSQMKSKFILAATIMLSLNGFAQKDELKSLKKIYGKETVSASDLETYKTNISKLESIATLENDKVSANFYKSMLPLVELHSLTKETATPEKIGAVLNQKSVAAMASGIDATLEYEKKSGKQVYTKDIQKTVAQIKPMFLKQVVQLDKEKNFAEVSELLHSIYLMDKTDAEKLYYAANYAVNVPDYDKALAYYEELMRIGYSGEGTLYWATNVASGQEENFPNRIERSKYLQLETHVKPRDEKLPSKRGEILKNITVIYIEKGRTEDAKKIITDARIANPNDIYLIVQDARLCLESKDSAAYNKLVADALVKHPTNDELYFNLGIVNYNYKLKAEAEKQYLKALSINPKHEDANMQMAILKLDPEKDLIDQMNKLGTSPADNQKYEVLKKKREDLFKSAIPYLEKAVQLNPENTDAASTLLGVYRALEMNDKAKALKAKMNN